MNNLKVKNLGEQILVSTEEMKKKNVLVTMDTKIGLEFVNVSIKDGNEYDWFFITNLGEQGVREAVNKFYECKTLEDFKNSFSTDYESNKILTEVHVDTRTLEPEFKSRWLEDMAELFETSM